MGSDLEAGDEVDLDAYEDPDVQAVRLDLASGGDEGKLAAIQAELRREEARGWCNILLMTDNLAVVRWHDEFVLTLTDKASALVAPLMMEREVSET